MLILISYKTRLHCEVPRGSEMYFFDEFIYFSTSFFILITFFSHSFVCIAAIFVLVSVCLAQLLSYFNLSFSLSSYYIFISLIINNGKLNICTYIIAQSLCVHFNWKVFSMHTNAVSCWYWYFLLSYYDVINYMFFLCFFHVLSYYLFNQGHFLYPFSQFY
jgi:hypothetical protein